MNYFNDPYQNDNLQAIIEGQAGRSTSKYQTTNQVHERT